MGHFVGSRRENWCQFLHSPYLEDEPRWKALEQDLSLGIEGGKRAWNCWGGVPWGTYVPSKVQEPRLKEIISSWAVVYHSVLVTSRVVRCQGWLKISSFSHSEKTKRGKNKNIFAHEKKKLHISEFGWSRLENVASSLWLLWRRNNIYCFD